MRRVSLLLLLLIIGVATSALGEKVLRETGVPEISPGEWVTTFLLAGARPIAVAVFWIKASQLREEQDYAALIPLYKTIVKLEPRFAPAWDFATYDLCVSIAFLERDPKKRFNWIKKGLLEFGYEGSEKTPFSGTVPSTVSFLLLKYYINYPDIAAAIESDPDLNPDRLPILRLAARWGERAVSIKDHPIIANHILDSVYTTLAERETSIEGKLYWINRTIELWKRLRRVRPEYADVAERNIERCKKNAADLEKRR